ncbi:hypothetical protein [Rufibacter sp. XAAS-G3-1]|uniref:hypothetical protein n=1 Tax=Rufibacter sp. XAAS-G3-1 TaxID=2729134 RepID=UPI0015E6BFEA|nr:hypothetical protein [Rufibacter sp. XAAS-G3-1]
MKIIGTENEEYPVEYLENGASFYDYPEDKIFQFPAVDGSLIKFYYAGLTIYKMETIPNVSESPRVYFQWKEKWYKIFISNNSKDIQELFSGEIIDVVEGTTLVEEIRKRSMTSFLQAGKEEFKGLYNELGLDRDEFWAKVYRLGVRFTREESEKIINYYDKIRKEKASTRRRINITPNSFRPRLDDFKEYGFKINLYPPGLVNHELSLIIYHRKSDGYTLKHLKPNPSIEGDRNNLIVQSHEYDIISNQIKLIIDKRDRI